MDDLGILVSTTQGKLSHFAGKVVSGVDQLCIPVSTTQGKMSFLRVRPCSALDQLCIPTVTTEGKIAWMQKVSDTGQICFRSGINCMGKSPSYGIAWKSSGEWITPPESLLNPTDPNYTLFPGAFSSTPIYKMIFFNNELYVVGNFATWQNTAAKKNIVRKTTADIWESPCPSGVPNGIIYDAIIWKGNLYVCGAFTSIDGVAAARIAKYDGSSWTALGSGLGDAAFGMYAWGDYLVVMGNFNTAGGGAAAKIATWDGTNWGTLGSGFGAYTWCAEEFGGNLVVGGAFTTADGNTAWRIAEWNGAAWSELGGGVNQMVYTLKTVGSKLLVGGNFTQVNSHISAQNSQYIAAWGGSSWDTVGAISNSALVTKIVEDINGNVIILSGNGTPTDAGKTYLGSAAGTAAWRWGGSAPSGFIGDFLGNVGMSQFWAYAHDGVSVEVFAGINSRLQYNADYSPAEVHVYAIDDDTLFHPSKPDGSTSVSAPATVNKDWCFWIGSDLYANMTVVLGGTQNYRMCRYNADESSAWQFAPFELGNTANSGIWGQFYEDNDIIVLYGGGGLVKDWPIDGSPGSSLGCAVRIDFSESEPIASSWSTIPAECVYITGIAPLIGGEYLVSYYHSTAWTDKYSVSSALGAYRKCVAKIESNGDWINFNLAHNSLPENITGGGDNVAHLYYDPYSADVYYCSPGDNFKLWKYSGGSWSNFATEFAGYTPVQILRHPVDNLFYLYAYADTGRKVILQWSGSGSPTLMAYFDNATTTWAATRYMRTLYPMLDGMIVVNPNFFLRDVQGTEVVLRNGMLNFLPGNGEPFQSFQNLFVFPNITPPSVSEITTMNCIADKDLEIWPTYSKAAF